MKDHMVLKREPRSAECSAESCVPLMLLGEGAVIDRTFSTKQSFDKARFTLTRLTM